MANFRIYADGLICLSTVLLPMLMIPEHVGALECFDCVNITEYNKCNKTKICNDNESCYKESTISGQTKVMTLGCTDNMHCRFHASSAGSLVGRDIDKRQDNRCYECCATDHCNELLCSHRKPTQCIDDETVDCPKMESIFGVCRDVSRAKLLCPKFCGLCDVVDGEWADWTQWSVCSVTCEVGKQVRSRTCSKPSPAHGGQDCIGNKTEAKGCQKQLCPVHGNWSVWSQWGTCSVTCDIGVQTRRRTCTNPSPQRFGDHCFGVNMDIQLCRPLACNDGGWTNWEHWGSCSVTCGDGFHTRSRSCTNPKPSVIGQYCVGKSFDVEQCSNAVCKENKAVSFLSALNDTHTYQPGDKVIFDVVKVNQGSAYNATNGTFTAPRNGMYQFSLTLTSQPNQNYSIMLVKNQHTNEFCYLYTENENHWQQSSTSSIVQLNAGDRVWVVSLRYSQIYGHRIHDYLLAYNSVFSGFYIGGY
ncbi:A disintegrin and metalloproteinase with thrombospondin motifs adt-1-like [Ruditapes philippinarum]|uniref:A disintegrin and metalloproteinase with thrombospondin motifs adt-1-like n=1 Tax=Ruditapes philippinarum TaxID=129788 RepID=UPI00295BC68F|nr:A disintegrin and metalloproteinase with thrombospondin motifs adt-1-like [Ruditapes philippinarum]